MEKRRTDRRQTDSLQERGNRHVKVKLVLETQRGVSLREHLLYIVQTGITGDLIKMTINNCLR